MILQPAADHLQKKRLLISADGILQNIPFSALTISPGEEYEPLIEQYEIVRSPSASAIAQIRQDT
ncbi:CHAT domain-containing protein, partial [Lyngbya sp. CCY1209]|uniref:CHAT domain-containing protein n=1 Tax=Lyngbya sp. CCY1209 TaxID=2886103 RepID=UPI002D203483